MFKPTMTYRQLTQFALEFALELERKADACPLASAQTALLNARDLVRQNVLGYVTAAQALDNTIKIPS